MLPLPHVDPLPRWIRGPSSCSLLFLRRCAERRRCTFRPHRPDPFIRSHARSCTSAVPPAPHPLAAPWRRGSGVRSLERLEISRYGGRLGVCSRPSQSARQHPLLDAGEVVFALGEVGLPRLPCPRSPPGCSRRSPRVPGPARRTPAGGRDGDPALLVGDLVVRAGEEHPAVGPGRLVGHRLSRELLGDPVELGRRETRRDSVPAPW